MFGSIPLCPSWIANHGHIVTALTCLPSLGQTGTTGEYKDTTDAPETTTGAGPTTESHGGYDAGGYNPGITPEASKATDTTNDYTPDTSTTTTDIGAGASTSGITGDSTRAGETTATDTPVADTGASTSETALPREDTTTTKDDSAAAALKDTDSGPTGEPDVAMGSNAGGAPPRPEHETDKTGVTDLHSNDSKFQTLDQSSANESSVAARGQDKATIGGVRAVEPSVGAKPEPTGEQEDAIVGEKKATEDAMDTGDSGPTDSSENSGQPLGESGDAGAGGPPAAEGEEEDGPNAKSKGTGTGMEYVKSSGVAADGGDFDAANPGAGREADRKFSSTYRYT